VSPNLRAFVASSQFRGVLRTGVVPITVPNATSLHGTYHDVSIGLVTLRNVTYYLLGKRLGGYGTLEKKVSVDAYGREWLPGIGMSQYIPNV
jgi:hypothetical protein